VPGEDAADRLYALPLEEFTAARNALAKELRSGGDREEAERVAALRKPSRPAWAINRAAREDAELPRALLDAAAMLAGAQEAVVSGSGRKLLDDAVRAEREAVEDFVAAARAELEAVGSAGQGMVDRVRKTLHAVAGDPELQEELAAARVVADREPVGFGAAPVRPVRPGGRKAAAKADRKTAAKPAGESARKATAVAAEREAARKQLADASRRADQAKRRVAKRERDLKRSRERLEKARRAVVAAEEEAAEIAEDLQRRRKELEDAEAVVAELS
jgi:hypothetical protein